jgi:hypothetical protein
MPDRFVNQYDEARSLLLEAVVEKYASEEQRGAILRGLIAIDILRDDAEMERPYSELAPT